MPSLGRYSPLKDRVLLDEACARTRVRKPVTNRPSMYRQYTDLHMREAVDAVAQNRMSTSKAAEVHGIPRTTLSDHVHGKILPGSKSGRPTLLSSTEERDLVNFLLESAKIGCGRTRKEVLAIVGKMLSARGNKEEVTTGWWNRFLKRHHELTLRTPATVSMARAGAGTRENIDNYFDTLEQILEETSLVDHPALIYNMDEAGFPLDPKPLKTVHRRGEKDPACVSSGYKSQVTVVACVSASGQSLPPLVIWKTKTMSVDMANGEIPGTQYGFSANGWMERTLFDSWFKKHFIRYAPASRPLLLLLDGHSSHYNPDTLKFAAENEVIIFALPPNTTHLTQPLDKGVFGPFKSHWRQVCHDFQNSHPSNVVNQYNFCSLLSKAWLESMTVTNIIAGFHTTGIVPLNREAIRLPSERVSETAFVPRLVNTPFKTRHNGGLYSASDKDLPSPEVYFAKRPNALTNIVEQKTPKIKSQRIKPGEDMVLTKLDLHVKPKTPKKEKNTPKRRTKTKSNSSCTCT